MWTEAVASPAAWTEDLLSLLLSALLCSALLWSLVSVFSLPPYLCVFSVCKPEAEKQASVLSLFVPVEQ
jgi:hypothetical protein